MAKILVTYASRMGGTAEIATAVARRLRSAGFVVDLTTCSTATSDVGTYDAVVVGSGLYVRRWLPDAMRFLRTHARDLADRPTYLFHSGPCGRGAETQEVSSSAALRRLARRIGADGPTTFGGRLQRDTATGPVSRWMATGELAGDYRDWDRIGAWTDRLVSDLRLRSSSSASDPTPRAG